MTETLAYICIRGEDHVSPVFIHLTQNCGLSYNVCTDCRYLSYELSSVYPSCFGGCSDSLIKVAKNENLTG